MVKTLPLTFDDDTFEKLKREKEKSGLNWREFILSKCLDIDDASS